MTADDRLAAELAIGLLDGEELLAARGRAATDVQFRTAVEDWERRLAPMLADIAPETPPGDVWRRIEAAVEQGVPEGEVVALRRRLRFWQRAAGGAAIAACVALALVFVRPPTTGAPGTGSPAAAAAPLVASIPIADTPLRLGVTFLPDRRELLVSASGLTADGVHDHELWLVRGGSAAPVSLGVVAAGRERRIPLDPGTAGLIHDGSAMVLTREPLGGKPAARAAGPVVAQGRFVRT